MYTLDCVPGMIFMLGWTVFSMDMLPKCVFVEFVIIVSLVHLNSLVWSLDNLSLRSGGDGGSRVNI